MSLFNAIQNEIETAVLYGLQAVRAIQRKAEIAALQNRYHAAAIRLPMRSETPAIHTLQARQSAAEKLAAQRNVGRAIAHDHYRQKKAAAMAQLQAFLADQPDASLRVIAGALGISHQSAKRYKLQLAMAV
jgi:hypothetical protein